MPESKTINLSEKYYLQTNKREEFVDLSSSIEDFLKNKRCKSGFLHIYCPHTTASVIVQESTDSQLQLDILDALRKIAPKEGFRHAEGNADAHIKSAITKESVCIYLNEGRLLLGTWQNIYFCEFDGPRKRSVYINFMGETY